MKTTDSTKVTFQGEAFWLLPPNPLTEGRALAPLSHCDEMGKLHMDAALTGQSFAHLNADGRLMRFGSQIGVEADLKPCNELRFEISPAEMDEIKAVAVDLIDVLRVRTKNAVHALFVVELVNEAVKKLLGVTDAGYLEVEKEKNEGDLRAS